MLLAQSASAGSSITMIVAYVILFGAIIYFMTIRPQKKQQKAADEMHAGMQAGDSVLTTSGFYGVIIDIMDDTVIVEFGNNRNCRIPNAEGCNCSCRKTKPYKNRRRIKQIKKEVMF